MRRLGASQELMEWVRRAARGEALAFEELYRRTRPLVARLVAGFASLDADEVEDVIQDTYVRAFRALPRLKEPGAFESWLLSIARNRARTRLERLGNVRRLEEAAEPTVDSVPIVPEALQLEWDLAAVRQLIEELPEGEEKRTAWLFYVEGELSAREIAEKLGVGKSAVTMRLERFRARIKRKLLQRVLSGRWE